MLFWAPGRIGWWIALLFMIGAALFAIGSAPALWPSLLPKLAASPEGIGWIYVVGALFYFLPLLLALLLEALHVQSVGRIDEDVVFAFLPVFVFLYPLQTVFSPPHSGHVCSYFTSIKILTGILIIYIISRKIYNTFLLAHNRSTRIRYLMPANRPGVDCPTNMNMALENQAFDRSGPRPGLPMPGKTMWITHV